MPFHPYVLPRLSLLEDLGTESGCCNSAGGGFTVQDGVERSDSSNTLGTPLVPSALFSLPLSTAFCSPAKVPSLDSLGPGAGQGLAAASFLPFLGRKPSWVWGAPDRGGGSVTTLLPKVSQPLRPHPSPGNLGHSGR